MNARHQNLLEERPWHIRTRGRSCSREVRDGGQTYGVFARELSCKQVCRLPNHSPLCARACNGWYRRRVSCKLVCSVPAVPSGPARALSALSALSAHPDSSMRLSSQLSVPTSHPCTQTRAQQKNEKRKTNALKLPPACLTTLMLPRTRTPRAEGKSDLDKTGQGRAGEGVTSGVAIEDELDGCARI